MTQNLMPPARQESLVPENLSVIRAAGMGWRLLRSDFWRLWLMMAVVSMVVGTTWIATYCMGGIPFVGACIGPPLSLVLGIFFWPPIDAGVFYVVRIRAGGAAVSFADVFAGFRRRYLHSLVAGLPVNGICVGMVVVCVIIGLLLYVLGMAPEQGRSPGGSGFKMGLVVGGGVTLLVMLASLVLRLFFTFTQVAVWDGAESRGAAIGSSMRVVRRKFFSTVWATFLFGVLGVASVLCAAVPGALLVWGGCLHWRGLDLLHEGIMLWMLAGMAIFLLACALVAPAFLLWFKASLVYLYCSWAGQPLMQAPPAAATPDAPASPEIAPPAV